MSQPKFVIVSAATPDYARQASIFTASWIRNSGAKEIHICTLPDPDKVGRKRCQAARNEVVRESTLAAQSRGLRVAMLDIDCWTLGDLSPAFDGVHPLAVARWPKINCGVQFYDTSLGFDFIGFFDRVIERVNEGLRVMKPTQQVGLIEQIMWEKEYHRNAEHVNELPELIWNLCVADHRWEAELRAHEHDAKIVHVKGRGQAKIQDWRIKIAYEVFGDRIHPGA